MFEEADAAAGVCGAVLVGIVFTAAAEDAWAAAAGVAGNPRLGGRAAAAGVAGESPKLGVAAVIDPDAAAVIAPVLAFNAGGFGALFEEADAAAGVCGAVLVAVLFTAAAKQGRAAAAGVSGENPKLGVTAVIDPDAAAVIAPGPAFDAGASGQLAAETDTAAPPCWAVLILIVVALAADDLSG